MKKKSIQRTLIAGFLTSALSATNALAANAPLQDLLFGACANAQGLLAIRCAETDGGAGNVSSDSESSLNPSQGLGSYYGRRDAAQDLQERSQAQLQHSEQIDNGPFSLIINAYSGTSEYTRQVDVDSERGYDRDDEALDLGFDYRVNDTWVIGALAQLQCQRVDFVSEQPGRNFTPTGNAGEIETDAVGVSLFLSRSLGDNGYLDVSYAHTRSSYDFERNALFQESNRVVDAVAVVTAGQSNGVENAFSVNAGMGFERNGWQLQPYASINVLSTSIDDYVEADLSNSGLAMAFDMSDNDTTLATAGLRTSRTVSFAGGVMVPTLRLQYTQPLDSNASNLRARYVNDLDANSLALTGTDFDQGYLDAALSVQFILPRGWMPFVEYQATTGIDDLDRWQIVAGIRKEL